MSTEKCAPHINSKTQLWACADWDQRGFEIPSLRIVSATATYAEFYSVVLRLADGDGTEWDV